MSLNRGALLDTRFLFPFALSPGGDLTVCTSRRQLADFPLLSIRRRGVLYFRRVGGYRFFRTLYLVFPNGCFPLE